jgi:hypothetical protein
MGHEDAVYLAKLAEQAERYEGGCSNQSFKSPVAAGNETAVESLTFCAAQRWSRT